MELIFSALIGLIVFLLGSAVGSFLNVVIYRVPAGLSILFPPSRCPQCLRPLKAYDNVPVLGWLWLKGRCRFCRSRIPVRYPLVEAATGLLFLWVYLAFDLSLLSLGYWAFLSWLLALALIDLDTLTLPNSLTQSGLVIGLLFQAGQGWLMAESAGAASQLMGGIWGAVLGLWLFELITLAGSMLFGQTAMGGGDAKLAAMMGAWLGWKLLLLAGFLACAIGAFAGGGAIALGLLSRRQPMPFGPMLALGAMLAVFFGEALLSGYVRLFFPGWA
ncbi:MAG: prepilin peptidase [Pegethrix bostrychoides GSE-TBD4-15B]|jgi:leader peptidase (prepilin peptidase)/N-methyltransferase|uniref:Prepilin leader peptidase/N-methyltransferase n=1 Tax=Pegethrix bostrychoides GSE-TBD4-15B TaxID=2839662 RepID=A0A951U705_9CYAN|nr:prepilin peptidase [Pegethrix bostrychoides GSE-TBD4-15B]